MISETDDKDSLTEEVPRTLNVSKMRKDSIAQDTLQKGARRDSLLARNAVNKGMYLVHPQNLDSLYNAYQYYPFQVFQTDGANLYDVLYGHPLFTPVPVALSSNMNRFLIYGLPADHISLHRDNSLLDFRINPTVGPNFFSAGEIKNIFLSSPGELSLELLPMNLVRPETMVQIEMGVFDESILDMRFARPLSQNVQLGIFSNFQYLRRADYSHSAGAIYGFFRDAYNSMGIDTSNVSRSGRNPLTREHITAATLAWTPGGTTDISVTYRYADIHNDVAFGQLGVPGDQADTLSLTWMERSHYNHAVNTQLTGIPLFGGLKLNGEALLQSSVNRLDPVARGATGIKRGENLKYAGAAMPYISFNTFGKADTLSVQFRTTRDEQMRYDGSKWTTHNTRAMVSYTHNFRIHSYKSSVTAMGGYLGVQLNGELEQYPAWKASLLNTLADQELRVFAMQDILPPTIPFDSTSVLIVPGFFLDIYQTYGAELQLRYKKAGLLLGSCLVNNIAESSVKRAWPNEMPPYDEPNVVFTVTPSFGRWHGLSGISQWILSDKKPFIKSKSVITYDIKRPGKALNLTFDLGFDFWSEREYLHYGGIDTWNRSIYDLHLKTTAQIKTFRLFYKVDNIFNRRIAYLPGYYMPGLVFRWGFNWIIQG